LQARVEDENQSDYYHRNIETKIDLKQCTDAGKTVMGLLSQALLNLCINARDANAARVDSCDLVWQAAHDPPRERLCSFAKRSLNACVRKIRASCFRCSCNTRLRDVSRSIHEEDFPRTLFYTQTRRVGHIEEPREVGNRSSRPLQDVFAPGW